MLFSKKKKILISAPSLYPLFPNVLILYLKCGGGLGGGGVMFFSHLMLFPTFINIWEYKIIISHLMFSLFFFCILEIL